MGQPKARKKKKKERKRRRGRDSLRGDPIHGRESLFVFFVFGRFADKILDDGNDAGETVDTLFEGDRVETFEGKVELKALKDLMRIGAA